MSGTALGIRQGGQNPKNDYISRFETTLNLTCWVYFTAGARPRGLILVRDNRPTSDISFGLFYWGFPNDLH